jgi:hypothetical protein
MNWIQTRIGLQMAEVIVRYLPRIVVCLEELSKKDNALLLDSLQNVEKRLKVLENRFFDIRKPVSTSSLGREIMKKIK